MVTRKQRRFYAVFVSISVILAIVFFGMVAKDSKLVLLYMGIAGFVFGDLVSGGILVVRYIKRKNSMPLTVVSCLLFPFTLAAMHIIGVFTLIPYYICNLVVLFRTNDSSDPQRMNSMTSKVNKITLIFVVSLVVVAFIGGNLYGYIYEASISKEISAKTGYAANTPDYVIIRDFYYTVNDADYSTKKDYHYVIDNNVLFALAKNKNIISSKIYFSNLSGTYSTSQNSQQYSFLSGKNMRGDIDKYFTQIYLMKKGNVFAYMLVLDTRTNDEHIKEYIDGSNFGFEKNVVSMGSITPELEKFILDSVDKTFANPDEINLHDEKGEPITRLDIDDKRYVMFCDAILTNDTDYKVVVSFQGEKYTLLTYEDMKNFNITSRD